MDIIAEKPGGSLGQRMHAMAIAGMPSPLIAALADVFMESSLSKDDRRYLAGPLVIHRNGWTDTLPKWMAEQVGVERIGIVFGTTPQYIVGPTEIAAVIYPACLEAPMGHYLSDLYIWATVHAYAMWKSMPVADAHTLLGMEPIEDAQVLEPRGRLFNTYRELAHDIRRRVINAQMAREKSERAAPESKMVAKKEVADAVPAFTAEQFSFFS